MFKDFLLIMLSGIFLTINPILGKIAVNKFGYNFFTFFRFVMSGIVGLFFFSIIVIYNYNYKKKIFVDLPYVEAIPYALAISLIAITYIYVHYYTLKLYDISYVIPLTYSTYILTSCVLGMLFFNEDINKFKLLGIILIIIGIFLLYYDVKINYNEKIKKIFKNLLDK
tara:strand:+ start:15868 stop:16371 length:504 start_codon:yes stop_codon:yes gene_type:complete